VLLDAGGKKGQNGKRIEGSDKVGWGGGNMSQIVHPEEDSARKGDQKKTKRKVDLQKGAKNRG